MKYCTCFKPLSKEHRYKEGSTNRRVKGPRVWFLKGLLCPVGDRETFTRKQLNQPGNAHFCGTLGCFITGNKEKQAWGQRLQYASTIIPGNCQSFVMYHLDPIQKVNQPMITKYQRASSVLINLRLSKACLQHFLLHFPHSGLAWASTCPSGIRILWLLQPFKATHTDFL